MAIDYRHECGHQGGTYDAWNTGEDRPAHGLCLACRAARIGEEICFARFGAPPKSGRSRNYREGTPEEGVSCYEMIGGGIQWIGWYFGMAERPLFMGQGIIVGWGSDGEPLVRVRTIRRATAAQKHEGLMSERGAPVPVAGGLLPAWALTQSGGRTAWALSAKAPFEACG